MTTRRPAKMGTAKATFSTNGSADDEGIPGYNNVSVQDINENMKKRAKELDARKEALVKREIEVKKQEEKVVKVDPVSGLTVENIGACVTQEDMVSLSKMNENQAHTICTMEEKVHKLEDEMEEMGYELGRAYRKINTLREAFDELETIVDGL